METTLDTERFRNSLEHQRIDLRKRIAKQADKKAEPRPETSSDRSFMAQRYITRQSRSNHLARAQQLLKQVEAALQRIEAGTYGRCLECGLAVQPDRLEALPYSEYCLDCKEVREGRAATP
ncbi:MAG: TraR/DksA family transcriptional regulator [Anaerolineales bacterium]|nr:TraR/DksA family transcriptional regulator [Anaerolineales bacterium]